MAQPVKLDDIDVEAFAFALKYLPKAHIKADLHRVHDWLKGIRGPDFIEVGQFWLALTKRQRLTLSDVETFCGWFHDGYEVVDIERGIQQAKDSFAQQGKPLYAAGGATASIEAIAHSMKEVRVGRGPK